VLTGEQSADRQVGELNGRGVSEGVRRADVGGAVRRPQLERALGELRAGDTPMVRRLDRLGEACGT